MFGIVLKGMETIFEIEKYGNQDGTPKALVKIANCYDPSLAK